MSGRSQSPLRLKAVMLTLVLFVVKILYPSTTALAFIFTNQIDTSWRSLSLGVPAKISKMNTELWYKSLLLRSTSMPASPLYISSGLSFNDGDQILISAQKPLGIVLEERELGGVGGGCVVADIDELGSAYCAGVRFGDWCVAVQNADVRFCSIDEVLKRIGDAPKVVNLRFHRNPKEIFDEDQY